jgi:hypothetical protein
MQEAHLIMNFKGRSSEKSKSAPDYCGGCRGEVTRQEIESTAATSALQESDGSGSGQALFHESIVESDRDSIL